MNTFTLILLVITGASLLCAVLVVSAIMLSGQISRKSSDGAQKAIKAKRFLPKAFRVKDPQEC